MNILAPLVLPTLLGLLVLGVCLRNSKLPNKTFFILALSPALGLSIASLLLFWSYVLGNEQGKAYSISSTILSIGLLAILAFRRDAKSTITSIKKKGVDAFAAFLRPTELIKCCGSSRWERMLTLTAALIFILVSVHYWRYYIATINNDVFGGWDARYFWSLKAKFYFREPGLWKGMFDPIIAWSHTDYPLMLPGSIAWGWNWANHEMFIWQAVVSFVFTLSLCFLIIWYIASHVSPWSGLLAGAFLLSNDVIRFWSGTHYADIPITFFMTAATLTAVCGLRYKSALTLFLAGLFSGMSAWTKNEGLSFIIWSVLLLAVALLTSPDIKKPLKKQLIFSYISGLVVPLATIIFLKTQLDVVGNEFVSTNRNVNEILSFLATPVRYKALGAALSTLAFTFSEMGGIWILFIVAIAVKAKHVFTDKKWMLVASVLCLEAGYCVILLITPDLMLELRTAFQRLLMHGTALTLIATFELMGSRQETAKRNPLV